jgi:hypothetical protein
MGAQERKRGLLVKQWLPTAKNRAWRTIVYFDSDFADRKTNEPELPLKRILHATGIRLQHQTPTTQPQILSETRITLI